MAETALGSASTGEPPAGSGNAGSPPATGTTAATGGTGEASWRDSLPADLKDNSALLPFKDLESMAKSFVHAQGMIGKKGAIVPDWAKSTPEEQQAFFKSIGVPDADKYEVAVPKDRQVDAKVVGAFKETALKAGLLPKQASELLDWYTKFEKDSLDNLSKDQKKAVTEQMDGLKKEWGDAYPKELALAQLAVKEIGGEEFVKYLDKSGMGNDVNLIKFAAKAAKLMGEDKLREGGVSGDGVSPDQIKDQLAELRANGDANGLYDKKHPMHDVTLRKMESLAKMLTGGR